MLKKRIIPCLDIKDGQTVKGVQFENLRFAGDPVELAKKYERDGADELVFLDISATLEKRKTLIALVEKLAMELTIPFTVGGGIASLADAVKVIESGADKIAINSAAVNHPELITQIAQRFGSQCVVVGVDVKRIDNQWFVFSRSGSHNTGILALDWAKEIEARGGGEILLTSMNNDGEKAGFAEEITDLIASNLSIPVIASGGAGSMEHFSNLFEKTAASAALAASIFHFNEIPIPTLKNYLSTQNIPVRK